MRGKNLICASLLTVLIVVSAMSFAVAGTPPKIEIDPSSLGNVDAGTFVTFDIVITNVVGLSGWEFKLEWDNAVLAPVDVVEGPFLSQNGMYATLFNKKLSPIGESLRAGCALLMPVTTSGSGVLATVTVKAVGAGSTTVDLVETDLRDYYVLPIDHNVFDSSINVHIGVEAEAVYPEKPKWSLSEDGEIITLSAEVRNHAGVDYVAYVEYIGFTMAGVYLRYETDSEVIPAHGSMTIHHEINATEDEIPVGTLRLTARAFWGADYYGAKTKPVKIEIKP